MDIQTSYNNNDKISKKYRNALENGVCDKTIGNYDFVRNKYV